MDTWDAIRSRRNVREYEDRPIPDADLDRILEAGRRAPSASNRQRWHFVVVTDKDQLDQLKTVWPGARHIPGSAATIVFVLPEPEEPRFRTLDQYDLGQATAQMLLAAVDLDIGSGHAAVGDQDAARRILRFPEGYYAAYMVGLGYPADRPLRPIENPARHPLDEIVHRGTW